MSSQAELYMGRVGSAYSTHKGTLMTLAVLFIASFAAMIVSSYAADHIHHGSCFSEAGIQSAYKASWRFAVVAGLVSAATAAYGIYLIVRHVTAKTA